MSDADSVLQTGAEELAAERQSLPKAEHEDLDETIVPSTRKPCMAGCTGSLLLILLVPISGENSDEERIPVISRPGAGETDDHPHVVFAESQRPGLRLD